MWRDRPIADIDEARQIALMRQSDSTPRRNMTTMLMGTAAGSVIGAVAALAAVLSGGAGHGSYVAARALFPFSLLLTRVEGSIGSAAICVGLLQFPLYGALIGSAITRKAGRVVFVLAAAHFIAAVACFSGLLPDFS
jgi:hypothetical protein